MATARRPWLEPSYALLHGEDSDGRRAAVEAWKAVARGPGMGGVLLHRLRRGLPLGGSAQRPGANRRPWGRTGWCWCPRRTTCWKRPRSCPPAVKLALQSPLPGTRLLLVARGTLSAGPGQDPGRQALQRMGQAGAGAQGGRPGARRRPPPGWRRTAASHGPAPGSRAWPARIAGAPGRQPRDPAPDPGSAGPARPTDRTVSLDLVDQATFRLGEQNAVRLDQGLAGRAGRPGPRRPCAWPWRTTPPAAAP